MVPKSKQYSHSFLVASRKNNEYVFCKNPNEVFYCLDDVLK